MSSSPRANRRYSVRPLKVVLLISSMLFGGSGVGFADESDGIRPSEVLNDLIYTEMADDKHRCDVYLPSIRAPKVKTPVVLVIHGGGWSTGDKWTMSGFARELNERDMAAVAINYRLAPKHIFPAQVDDVRSALLWIAKNEEQYRWDGKRIAVTGYSAGGHLSLLVGGLQDESLAEQLIASHWPGDDPRWSHLPKIKAVAVGGPYCNFNNLPVDSMLMGYFLGGSRRQFAARYRAASPLSFVSTGDPPTVIVHGVDDVIVPIAGAREFHQKQKDNGVESEMIEQERRGHITTFMDPRTANAAADFLLNKLMIDHTTNAPSQGPKPR